MVKTLCAVEQNLQYLKDLKVAAKQLDYLMKNRHMSLEKIAQHIESNKKLVCEIMVQSNQKKKPIA